MKSHVPQELIKATRDNARAAGFDPPIVVTLASVPDDWAKINGEWIEVTSVVKKEST